MLLSVRVLPQTPRRPHRLPRHPLQVIVPTRTLRPLLRKALLSTLRRLQTPLLRLQVVMTGMVPAPWTHLPPQQLQQQLTTATICFLATLPATRNTPRWRRLLQAQSNRR